MTTTTEHRCVCGRTFAKRFGLNVHGRTCPAEIQRSADFVAAIETAADAQTELGALMAEDAENVGPAFLEGHSYGDRPQHWDDRTRHFVIVRCDDPSHGPIALNSGHHYTDDVRAHAVRLMAEHNLVEHGKSGIDTTERTSR